MDTVSPETRSRIMAAVPQKHTKPEILVRKICHALGRRFRLHRRDLPGSPDLVFPKDRKAIFVHGCFWHRHGCRLTTTPKSNAEFWQEKFDRNRERDLQANVDLQYDGWEVLVIWQCETKDSELLVERLATFLTCNQVNESK
ncbi:MAG TPA: very short patch repair endonuclease [Planctomycetaceae bacterium]|uniref:very short patch repair endonuclease n=1 Tax=Rubinisphaera sp. TaxID=2024857 RepID=UPI000C0FC493|nr:very short patch repair endonuclease [Rubinisphaera sp.]HCS52202.1 very short patch repair endonuclease [Planctomycetaceae bacterium]